MKLFQPTITHQDDGSVAHSVSMEQAGRFSLALLLALLLGLVLPFYLLWGTNILLVLKYQSFLFLVLFIVLGVLIHELLHAGFWILFSKVGWRSVSFGFKWEYLSPYCHCSKPLKVWQFALGAAAPLLLMGILPVVVALINGHALLMFFGTFYIWAAAGDILTLCMLRQIAHMQKVLDHPGEVGFIVS